MIDYKAYLAAKVLNDKTIASYRSLSRDLKVHVNLAKHLLYEFYQQENSKRPGTVHATYLVSGQQTVPDKSDVVGQGHGDGEDTPMQSSPFMSSPMPPQDNEGDQDSVTVVTLAGEENLEAVKTQYDEISSIHIYSLGPSIIQNLQILSDCNRVIAEKHISDDPLETGKQYGVIQNGQVKRRSGRRLAAVNQSSKTEQTIKPINNQSQGVSRLNVIKSEGGDKDTLGARKADELEKNLSPKVEIKSLSAKKQDAKTTAKTTSLKRNQPDIFKSFSKPAAKLIRENINSSAAPVVSAPSDDEPSAQIETQMKDSSDDEENEEVIEESRKASKSSKSKSQREEELRNMMDTDEDTDEKATQDSDHSMDFHEPALVEETGTPHDPPVQPSLTISGGRRRGRRKVMKRKTLKDEEGYLVTKEEAVWESFSEDEPVVEKDAVSSSAGKAKKLSGKPGQGNIMSFFGKR